MKVLVNSRISERDRRGTRFSRKFSAVEGRERGRVRDPVSSKFRRTINVKTVVKDNKMNDTAANCERLKTVSLWRSGETDSH